VQIEGEIGYYAEIRWGGERRRAVRYLRNVIERILSGKTKPTTRRPASLGVESLTGFASSQQLRASGAGQAYEDNGPYLTTP
jgi:hypothetical protein